MNLETILSFRQSEIFSPVTPSSWKPYFVFLIELEISTDSVFTLSFLPYFSLFDPSIQPFRRCLIIAGRRGWTEGKRKIFH